MKCRVLNRTVNEISEDPNLSFEVELDLDPLPIPTCPDVEHTPTGYYPPLLPEVSSGETAFPLVPGSIITYSTGSIYPPFNTWGFPIWRYTFPGSHEGIVDVAANGVGNGILVYPKGNGTMTVYGLSVAETGTMYGIQLFDDEGDLITVIGEEIPCNTPFTFEINEALDGRCEHIVGINSFSWLVDGGGGGPSFCFDGIDWVSMP